MSYQIATEGFFSRFKKSTKNIEVSHNNGGNNTKRVPNGHFGVEGLLNILQPTIFQFFPNTKYKSIVLQVEDLTDCYRYEFWVIHTNGKVVKCYDLPGFDSDAYTNTWTEVNDGIAQYRKENPSANWAIATFVIDSNGKFKVDFEYDENLVLSYPYSSIWEYKYLGITPEKKYKESYAAVQDYIKSSTES